MKKPLIAVVMITTLAACTQVPRAEQAAAKLGPNGEELICERVPIPGKIYPGKICMTEEQWAQHKGTGSEAVRDTQRRSLTTAAPGSGG